ncbi:hypothetical protein MKQ68_06190 [Chitinophaga horti]|uniref:YD repeat-containing protein n=1 Tax=Chitinophaga horti TaxID=2920382 RepID=A0ABY6J4Z4_9BACT|nr:hypothetical protein [Chitinophaga horti]UYQ94678.1 hypothetical protein MKQ68_06190 [Chitinophaga horti]
MKNYILAAACLVLAGLTACSKEEKPPKPTTGTTPQFLLKTIEYQNSGTKAELTYNADSTLKQIAYTNQQAAAAIYYKYDQKRVIEGGYTNSIYVSLFTYNGAGKVTKIFTQTQGNPTNGYTMEYSYNIKGEVVSQRYFQNNEAGSQLKAFSDYTYNAQGLLSKVITTNGNNKLTYNIEAYSDEYAVSPWVFVPMSLTEFYPIYNYPVLSSMKRLPAKITRLQQLNGGTVKTERIDQQKFEITDKKINKLITLVDYPEHPELHAEDTAVFKY